MVLGKSHRGGFGGVVEHLFDAPLYRAALYHYYHLNPRAKDARTKWLSAYYITRIDSSSSSSLERTINHEAIAYAQKKVRVGERIERIERIDWVEFDNQEER